MQGVLYDGGYGRERDGGSSGDERFKPKLCVKIVSVEKGAKRRKLSEALEYLLRHITSAYIP